LRYLILPLLLILPLTIAPPPAQNHPSRGLRVPPGFEVTEYAGSNLANDIYTLTVDPSGRIVVAGRGYIRILVDDDGDGKADRAIDFADTPKDGAMGLLWEGDTLYVTGDGGLRRFRDRDGDDKADGPSEMIRKVKTGGEHTAHALRRGPDGWLYLLCGNTAGIDKSYAQLPTSPVKEPIAGCVLRFTPDLKQSEIVAHGYRNPYSMDFGSDGELFTFDSDNERCVALPWYEFTRFYHVVPGGFYGWLSPQRAEFWRCPPYFADVEAPVTTLGRGSPTGVACYRHVQFPKKYQGGFFAADWTFGRIYFLRLTRASDSYRCEKEVFLEAVGDDGFAPTGMIVHPKTGDLYISIGGRGTRGAVYRVHYKNSLPKIDHEAVKALQPRHGPAGQRKQSRALPPAEIAAKPVLSLRLGLELLQQRRVATFNKLSFVRIVQLALGDLVSPKARGTVWEGYTLRRDHESLEKQFGKEQLQDVVKTMRSLFPSGKADLDRELSRTLGLLEDPDPQTLGRIANKLAATADPIEQVHYLIVLARLPAPRTAKVTVTVANALLGLDRRLEQRHQATDSNWPLRMSELYRELARKDVKLNDALLAHPDFGRPAHALFAKSPGCDTKRAATLFLRKAKADSDYAWNAALVQIVSALPPEQSLPVLRGLWGKAGLEPALLPLLARDPQPEDRDKFIDGLGATDLATVRACLGALQRLPAKTKGPEILAALLALHRFPRDQAAQLHEDLVQHLGRITGQKLGADRKAWDAWFTRTYPDLAGRLTNPDGVDLVAWERRLARLNWPAGSAPQGRQVFVKARCASCHSGGQALGPDLHGVAKRFSRDDLLTAILQPSKDVSPRYQTTLIETTAGKIYMGLIIYEAVDGTLLQTGTATVRIPGDQIASQRRVPTSLMPAGLLDNLSDQEIVDLVAYLRALKN
jgi:putative membrane-bound dehydrogenase-like protein